MVIISIKYIRLSSNATSVLTLIRTKMKIKFDYAYLQYLLLLPTKIILYDKILICDVMET